MMKPLIVTLFLCASIVEAQSARLLDWATTSEATPSTEPEYWELTVQTTTSPQNYVFDINAGTGIDIDVDYGDGSVSNYVSTGLKTHAFATAGTYSVKISGSFATLGNFRLGFTAGTTPALVKATGPIGGIDGIAILYGTFHSCANLTSIPEDLFRYCNTNGTDDLQFYATFMNCSGLTTIPADLFRYNVGSANKAFGSTFRGCTSLTTVPADLFRYNTEVSGDAFNGTFYGCTSLTTIPADLFRYNLSSTAVANAFKETFRGCTSITNIPTDLFRYNTALAAYSFNSTFYGCTSLTTIPTDLFRYNTAVTTSAFGSTFRDCTSLTTVPADLFRYNTEVTSDGFKTTFFNCPKLTMRSDVFGPDLQAHFEGRTVSLMSFFDLSSAFTGTQGTAPALWAVTNATLTATDCFDGHSEASLSNYADIPEGWR